MTVAKYDDPSGKTRYEHCYYDGYAPRLEGTTMTQIILGFAKLTVLMLIQFAKNVHTALTANPDVPAPKPSLAELQAGITAAETANNEYEESRQAVQAKLLARDDALQALEALLRTEANTVLEATGGDPTKIVRAGFQVKQRATPIGIPGQVMLLTLHAGALDGSVDANWQTVRGARLFELQFCTGASPDTWVDKGSVSKTRVTLGGLTSGSKLWLRVRAVGTAGHGEWSQPAWKIVP